MSRTSDDLELRMFLVGASAAAMQVGDAPVNPKRTFWIPRYIFSLPEWKVDQAGLWEWVTN